VNVFGGIRKYSEKNMDESVKMFSNKDKSVKLFGKIRMQV
jgi:hypothetical protein